MFFIQSFQANSLRNNMHKIGITKREVSGNRGNIYDRNGESFASTINKYTFWVNTNKKFVLFLKISFNFIEIIIVLSYLIY